MTRVGGRSLCVHVYIHIVPEWLHQVLDLLCCVDNSSDGRVRGLAGVLTGLAIDPSNTDMRKGAADARKAAEENKPPSKAEALEKLKVGRQGPCKPSNE